jgi:hypothetical protein
LFLPHLVHAAGGAHSDFDRVGLQCVIIGLPRIGLYCDADIVNFFNFINGLCLCNGSASVVILDQLKAETRRPNK